ncbi:Rab GTPase [Tieghemostelium lacteum]|uniref:Rab GTPase n=1 Tax=Tieghemostelium lacteum TaxID=361077 RepID=A0A151ZE60_TIELA|nr:Rab GTPase [Tieghemostelium lacteum]|eukprot:KYQ92174.1 Rab GTPase [Tieghemostelium lacteum]
MSKNAYHANDDQEGNEDPISLKILVVGKLACGKTSIIQRYCNNDFQGRYKPTIGVDFQTKEIEVGNRRVILQLWDIAGQERFGHMTRVYFQNADGAIVVFDATRPGTFTGAKEWKDDIDNCFPAAEGEEGLPTILLANKIDLLQPPYQFPEDIDTFCQNNVFYKHFFTSAKEDTNINEGIDELVKKILESEQHQKTNPNAFKLTPNTEPTTTTPTTKTCC